MVQDHYFVIKCTQSPHLELYSYRLSERSSRLKYVQIAAGPIITHYGSTVSASVYIYHLRFNMTNRACHDMSIWDFRIGTSKAIWYYVSIWVLLICSCPMTVCLTSTAYACGCAITATLLYNCRPGFDCKFANCEFVSCSQNFRMQTLVRNTILICYTVTCIYMNSVSI